MFNVSRFNNIKRHVYKCEVVTPMFLGGANPDKPELRVPPIKAALRFWWRALNVKNSIAILREEEARRFGDAGDQFGKSNLTMNLLDDKTEIDQYRPLPHHQTGGKGRPHACIKSASRFQLAITGTEQQHALFKLFCILGGIGKRCRRGFGSIRITDIDGTPYDFTYTVGNIFNLIDSLCPHNFQMTADGIERTTTHTGVNYAYLKAVRIGHADTSYKDILKTIGQVSSDFNSHYTGYVYGRERFASPVYVTVNRTSNDYRPVISVLHTAFKTSRDHDTDQSVSFIRAIL